MGTLIIQDGGTLFVESGGLLYVKDSIITLITSEGGVEYLFFVLWLILIMFLTAKMAFMIKKKNVQNAKS